MGEKRHLFVLAGPVETWERHVLRPRWPHSPPPLRLNGEELGVDLLVVRGDTVARVRPAF